MYICSTSLSSGGKGTTGQGQRAKEGDLCVGGLSHGWLIWSQHGYRCLCDWQWSKLARNTPISIRSSASCSRVKFVKAWWSSKDMWRKEVYYLTKKKERRIKLKIKILKGRFRVPRVVQVCSSLHSCFMFWRKLVTMRYRSCILECGVYTYISDFTVFTPFQD
jgi:hypothetical protein